MPLNKETKLSSKSGPLAVTLRICLKVNRSETFQNIVRKNIKTKCKNCLIYIYIYIYILIMYWMPTMT